MKLYIFEYFTLDDISSVGIIPRINASKIKSQWVLEKKESYFQKFYPNDVSFEGMYLSYGVESGLPKEGHILCDMHGWIETEPRALVYPVSPKLNTLLSLFHIPEVAFYPGSVDWERMAHLFFVMHLLTGQYQYIDFAKSTFVKCNFRGVVKSDEIKTGVSIDELNQIYGNDSFTFARAVMKPEFRALDMYYMDIWGILITERLKEAIEKANLTGVKITECPIEFEFSDEL